MQKNSNKLVSRFYNNLIFNENTVIKGAPKDRYANEIRWFKEAMNRIPDNIPDIIDYQKRFKSEDADNLKYYEMEAIKGENLYQYLRLNTNKTAEIQNKIIEVLEMFHQEYINPKEEDIYQMYLLKPKQALQEFIRNKNINFESIIINGYKFKDPIKTLEHTFNDLKKQLMATKFSFMHGDLTLSNILIDENGDLYLIDPRGKFGNTKIFGDIRYDISKLYYSLVGNYDSLNNGNFNYKLNDKMASVHTYSIDSLGLESYGEHLLSYFNQPRHIIRFIHSTIWLSLVPHVKDNINQQYCTFCHGIFLLNTIYE